MADITSRDALDDDWCPGDLFLYFWVDGEMEAAKELMRDAFGSNNLEFRHDGTFLWFTDGPLVDLEEYAPVLDERVPCGPETGLEFTDECFQKGLTNASMIFLRDPDTDYRFSLMVELARILGEKTNVVLSDTDEIVYSNLELEGDRLEPSKIPPKPAEF